MHKMSCQCRKCSTGAGASASAEFEVFEFELPPEDEFEDEEEASFEFEALNDGEYEDEFEDEDEAGFSELDSESPFSEGEEAEWEMERRGVRGVARSRPAPRGGLGRGVRSRSKPRRGVSGHPRPPQRRRPASRPFGRPQPMAAPCVCPAHGTEFVRWVQSTLNQVAGSRLRVNGVMNLTSRRALEAFQRRAGLPVDGIAGPDTEQALRDARGGQGGGADSPVPPAVPVAEDSELFEFEAIDLESAELLSELDVTFPGAEAGHEEGFVGNLFGRALDYVRNFGKVNIVDRTAFTPKDKRKKMRDLSKVYALVLHQTGSRPYNDVNRYRNVTAHYVILPDGTIVQNHPDAALLWSSHGLNTGSVAVEFVGNFPSTRGLCWHGGSIGCYTPTQEQIASGRALVVHLIRTIDLTHVLAHRQSAASRSNDPGPDIWKGVGQWAVETLGMQDGGPTFKVGDGQPIPETWRTWGR